MKRTLLLFLATLTLAIAPSAFSQKILDLIPLADRPGFHSAINPLTGTLYVPMLTTNQLAVFDSSSATVTYIPLGLLPTAVAVNPKTNLVYVEALGDNGSDAIYVVDGSSNAVIDTISVTGGYAIAVNSVTNMIYFESGGQCAISVLDGATNQIIATIPTLGQNAEIDSLVVNPVTNRIYLSAPLFNQTPPTSIAVIDGSSETLADIITGPSNSCPGAVLDVDWTLNRIYASSCQNLYVLSGKTQQWVETISVFDGGPVAVNQTNHEIAEFSVAQPPNTLYFFSGSTYATLGQVPFSTFELPYGLVADSSTDKYYVLISDNGKKGAIAILAGP
jgi:DNA-binding beta-propeller fold protein YncE